jgi:hypothetical protein
MKGLVITGLMVFAPFADVRAEDGEAALPEAGDESVVAPATAAPEAPSEEQLEPSENTQQPSESEPLIFIDFALGGGSVVGFTDPLSSGHLVYGGLMLHWDDLAIGVSGSGVYPGSRVQTRFGAMMVDARWYYLGTPDVLAPYVVAGLGFSTHDALGDRTPPTDVVRWAGDAPSFIFSPGVGLRWGLKTGLFVHAEARVVNLSHAIFTIGGGFAL